MRLIILGAQEYGRRIAKLAAETQQYQEILFLDDDLSLPGVVDLFANFVLFMDDDTAFYPAFAENGTRVRWLNHLMSLGCALAGIVHPTAEISRTAVLLPGIAVFAHAQVGEHSLVKIGCVLNAGAVVEERCVLEPGVNLGENVLVKSGAHIPQLSLLAGE